MVITGADMYEKEQAKAEILLEAIPYVRKFAGETVVIKYGGSAMIDERLKKAVIKDVAMLKYLGLNPIIVHGGGKEITATLEKMGMETLFVDGLRVTDAETAHVAEMVLSGSIGKSLVENLESVGIRACGINGKDGHTLVAKKKVDEKANRKERLRKQEHLEDAWAHQGEEGRSKRRNASGSRKQTENRRCPNGGTHTPGRVYIHCERSRRENSGN